MKKVVSIIDPTIKLSEITIPDFEYGTGDYDPDGTEPQRSKTAGNTSPFIEINGMVFSDDSIRYFEIDTSSYIPRLEITLSNKKSFDSNNIPKDGDIVKVYIQSRAKDFKSIRQDYRITESDVGAGQIIISGVLDIPQLYMDDFVSYKDMTSFEVIQDIAKQLGLGLASNILETNDRMTWLRCGTSIIKFLNEDLIKSCYIDDDSFIMWFIDEYYYINLIEVNELLSHDSELDNIDAPRLLSHKDDENYNTVVFLTNSKNFSNMPGYFSEYSVIQSFGNSLKDGYRKYLGYHDVNDDEYKQYFIEPSDTAGSDDMIILKGRIDEDVSSFKKTIYVGSKSDNTFNDYLFARVLNDVNKSHITKMGLRIKTNYVNNHISLFQLLPVVIVYDNQDIERKVYDEKDGVVYNKVLTGYYLVYSTKYVYSSNRFYNIYTLYKREYNKPL